MPLATAAVAPLDAAALALATEPSMVKGEREG